MKFKYIDKYWKKGRWNYVYPNDTKNRPLTQPKNVTPGFGIGQKKPITTNRYANKLNFGKAPAATSKQTKTKSTKDGVDNILKKIGGTALSKVSKIVEKGKSFVSKKIGNTKEKVHEQTFDKKQAELKTKREAGYAAEAKAKTEAAQKKLAETKSKVESNKKQAELKNKREAGYAAEAKKKAEAQNTKLVETRANKRSDSYAKDAAYKEQQRQKALHDQQVKRELAEYDRSKFHREVAKTHFGLDNLDIIDRKNVGTTKEETAKINPDYDPTNPETSMNCGFCSVAWILRKKGYDVEAKHDMVGDWNDDEYGSRGTNTLQLKRMFVDPLKSTKTVTVNSGPLGLKLTKKTVPNYADKEEYPFEHMYDKNLNEYIGSTAYTSVVAKVEEGYGNKNQKTFEKHAEEIILKESKNNNYGMLTVSWKIGGGHALNYQVENGKVMVYDGQVNKTYPLSELLPRVNSLEYLDCTSLVPTDNVNLVVQNRRKK